MTIYEECKLFKSWGQNDANYYKVFVGAGLTADQYKEITGEDYVTPTSESTSTTATTSESTSATATASETVSN